MNQNIKILPLLIFVAILAFSVRLAGVVSGVSELSGSAYAKTEKVDKDESATKEDHADEDKDTHKEGDTEHKMDKMVDKESKPKKMVDKKVNNSKWRDAKDEDPTYAVIQNELFDEMAQRRKGLDAKERNVKTREALLKAAEQELDRKYQELSQLKKEIESLLETQSDEELKRVASLVKIYEGMKPKDAARIFDTLDLDVLIAVVASMSERKLSPILAAMNPERARTITIMLAEQKKLPTLPR